MNSKPTIPTGKTTKTSTGLKTKSKPQSSAFLAMKFEKERKKKLTEKKVSSGSLVRSLPRPKDEVPRSLIHRAAAKAQLAHLPPTVTKTVIDTAAKYARDYVPLLLGEEAGLAIDVASALYSALSDAWTSDANVNHSSIKVRPKTGTLSPEEFDDRLVAIVNHYAATVLSDSNVIDWSDFGLQTLLRRLYSLYLKDGFPRVLEFLRLLTLEFKTDLVGRRLHENLYGVPGPGLEQWNPSMNPPDETDQLPYEPPKDHQGKPPPHVGVKWTSSGRPVYDRPEGGRKNEPYEHQQPARGGGYLGRPTLDRPMGGGFGGAPPAIAYSTSGQLRPQHATVVGSIHTDFGPGIRITGRQLMCNIGESSGITTSLFSTDTSAISGATIFSAAGVPVSTVLLPNGGNVLKLSPDFLNLRLATIAQLYSRWKFVNFRVLYTPSVSTTTPGNFTVGFSEDVGTAALQTLSYATTTQMARSNICQYWAPLEFDVSGGGDDEFLYTESGTGGSATTADRQTCHGLLSVFPNTNGSIGQTYGTLWCSYDIVLADPSPSYGLAVTYLLKQQIGDNNLALVTKYLLANPVLLAEIMASAGVIPPVDNSSQLVTFKGLIEQLETLGLVHNVEAPMMARLTSLIQDK